MARKRVVSRTISTAIVTALVTDILEAKAGQVTVTIGGGLKDKALEKAVKKQIEATIQYDRGEIDTSSLL